MKNQSGIAPPPRFSGVRRMTGAFAGLLPARRLLLLALLALAVALAALAAAESTQASAGRTVAADWEHLPDGIEPGDSFRLLFVTSSTRDASSSNIADYNAFVRAAAGTNAGLKPFKDGFTALISTGSVNIKDNTATTGTGVPIHWLGGDKVADDYADLYDLSWDSVSGVDRERRLLHGPGVDRGQRVWRYVAAELRRRPPGAHGRPERPHAAPGVARNQGRLRGVPLLRPLAGPHRGGA